MPTRLFLSLLVILLLSTGCQRFQDKFASVASLCDVDPASVRPDEIHVKLESPQGTELSAANLLTTRSRFLSSSRQAETLAISSRGCVRVRAEAGVLQAFSSAEGWSVSRNLDEFKGQKFLRLPLQPSPRVSAELRCPAPGFYAHESLDFPLRWTSDGALDAVRFEIVAVDAAQKSHSLFEKAYGQDLTAWPQNIRTVELPEGQYELRLNFQVSTEGWDQPGPVPSRMESCPLTVLHRRPEVGSLDAYPLHQNVAYFSKDALLPWKTESAASELFVCREKRGEDLDTVGVSANEGVCAPQAQCQDFGNFQSSAPFVAEEVGIFDYYVYAEDRAGNRSSLSCQTLIITEQRPDLELLWSEASWNIPAAQMQIPRGEVQLRIRSQHPQLQDSTLPALFQCRADFVREDQTVLSGHSIVCLSERCRNQTLEKFVPCDAEVQLSIGDLLPRMKSEGGRLRVFVQVDDRAGHVNEQMASIGIQPQRWKPILRSPSTTSSDLTNFLLQDHQQRIFQSQALEFELWNETENRWDWQAPPPELSGGSLQGAWLSREGYVFAAWTLLQKESIYRWHETGWQKVPSLDAYCLNPQSFHRGGFWCYTETELAIYEGDSWTRIPYPADDRCVAPSHPYGLVRDQQQTLWLACASRLYQRRAGENAWTPANDGQAVVKIEVDAQERLWIIRGTNAESLQIEVWEQGQFRNLPKPESFTWTDLRPQDFVIGPAGEIILGDAYWDDSRNTWRVFPYLVHRQSGQRVRAHFLGQGELFWEIKQGILHWDGARVQHWDLSTYGLELPNMPFQAALGKNGVPWILASPGNSWAFPYQFQLKNWVYFSKPTGFPNSSIAGLWVDEQSIPHVYIPDDGFYMLDSSGWNRFLRSPAIDEETPVDTRTFEPILLSPYGFYRWTPEEDWTRIDQSPESRYYWWGGTRDALGRIWVYQDSMNLGVIDGSRFEKVSLDEDAGSYVFNIFARTNGITIATDRGLLTRENDQTIWTTQLWSDWGLESVDRVRQLDDDTFLVSISEEGGELLALWLLDLKTQSKQEFKLPEATAFLGDVQKTSKGDYIMNLRFDVFRTDGVNYTKIFARKDFDELHSVTGIFPNVFRLQVDAHDRVWFHTGYGVIQMDL